MDIDMEGNCQTPNPQNSESGHEVRVVKLNAQCPAIKNHSAVFYKSNIYIFGGYDSKKNHNQLHIFNTVTQLWSNPDIQGSPDGRNGHTATVYENKMFVIGGWLGQGTYASSDVWVLDLDQLMWQLLQTRGEVPGPCNMHSADLVDKMIYIFRGGDGRDYLNDLHCLNTETSTWKLVFGDGICPPPRANHSSSVVKNKLFIFGGWDGMKRLNDLYCFDTDNNMWSEVKPYQSPSARAGMCMTTLNDKIYMFGGSGPQAMCYDDIQIYDPIKNYWGMAEIKNKEDKIVQARAGHSMTVVADRIYIFGGSQGQIYYKDFFIIDTNAPPEVFGYCKDITEKRLLHSFRKFFNNPLYSDIQFLVQGQTFYGHKIVLTRLCERLDVAFQSEMMDSTQEQMEVPDTTYDAFLVMAWYLYTGEINPDPMKNQEKPTVKLLLDLMRLSDYYLIDGLKLECELLLKQEVNQQTCEMILVWSERCNAQQLRQYCTWYDGQMKKHTKY